MNYGPRLRHGEYVGGKETPEHYVWRTMLRRKQHREGWRYADVEVCARWTKFENFLADMGRRPSPQHSLDRRDPFGHYAPENCRWATKSEQQKNKRNTKRWQYGGFAGTLVECAQHIGISKELAHWRMKNWGTFEKGVAWDRLLSLK